MTSYLRFKSDGDMNLTEALERATAGNAISRKSWGDPDRIVHVELRGGQGFWDEPAKFSVFRAPQDVTQDDLLADDWFVVAAIN